MPEKELYAVVDLETTGLSPVRERITEIAVIVHDGEKTIETFSSLINPERSIPPYISSITGISNEMVSQAPKFYEIAEKVVRLTEGKIFTAHNANFDYSFIKNEFKRLGYPFNQKKICTVRLARKYLPGKSSYSLGKLCSELGIPINGRHRAMGDAEATVKLFELIREKSGGAITLNTTPALSPLLDSTILKKIPEATGVYYFFDQSGTIIYIGKSKTIYSRILSHLSNTETGKSVAMRNKIADIDWVITGSELAALLLESDEIKKHQPLYNRAQKRTGKACGIYKEVDENGYIRINLMKINPVSEPLITFSSAAEAKNFLQKKVDEHRLCQKLCGLYKTSSDCFYHKIRLCKGACIQKEAPGEYNHRVESAFDEIAYPKKNFFIMEEGRKKEERTVIHIENGIYRGFGYISEDCGQISKEDLKASVTAYDDNRDVRRIISGHLAKNNPKVITY